MEETLLIVPELLSQLDERLPVFAASAYRLEYLVDVVRQSIRLPSPSRRE